MVKPAGRGFKRRGDIAPVGISGEEHDTVDVVTPLAGNLVVSTRGFNGFDLDSIKIGPVRNQDICLMAMIE